MLDMVSFMAAPFAACLVLVGIHAYFGIHVIERRVLFVDLAVAQFAALGAIVGFFNGHHPGEVGSTLYSLAFATIAAALFAITRMRHEKLPQEAIIGITFVVASAEPNVGRSTTAANLASSLARDGARVILVAPPAEGGLATHIISLLAALHRDGYPLAVVCEPGGRIAEAASEHEAPLVGLTCSADGGPAGFALGVARLARAIPDAGDRGARDRPDVNARPGT